MPRLSFRQLITNDVQVGREQDHGGWRKSKAGRGDQLEAIGGQSYFICSPVKNTHWYPWIMALISWFRLRISWQRCRGKRKRIGNCKRRWMLLGRGKNNCQWNILSCRKDAESKQDGVTRLWLTQPQVHFIFDNTFLPISGKRRPAKLLWQSPPPPAIIISGWDLFSP